MVAVPAELPPYLAEEEVETPPAPGLNEMWARLREAAKVVLDEDAERQQRRAYARKGSEAAPPPRPADPRGTNFSGMIPVPACRLDDAIHTWWTEDSRGDVLTVARRLRLRHPEGSTPDVVAMDGTLRRLLPGPRIRVRLELWPHLDRWALYSLRPLRHLIPSRWYFRTGNGALDLLSRRLVGIAQQMDR